MLESEVIVNRLNESICQCTSKPNKTHTPVCNQERTDLLTEEMAPCSATGQLMLKGWLPSGFQGMHYGEEILNHGN